MMREWFFQGLGWGVSLIAAAAVLFLAFVAGTVIVTIINAFVEGWKSGGDDDEDKAPADNTEDEP